MRKTIRLMMNMLPIFAVGIIILQFIVSNELVTIGKTLRGVETDIRQEEDMHEVLSARVASHSSLLTIRLKAETLGFIEPTTKEIFVLPAELPVAAAPDYSR